MRMRYKVVTYHFAADQSGPQSLQRHYRELMDELLRQGPQHALTQRTVQWRPASDIHETPEAILVKMELAGVHEEDLEITLYEDALVVTGKRDDDAATSADVWYHEAQIRYGPFRAEILLPAAVQREHVEARYENGFLRVMLPKATRGKPADVRGGEARRERPERPDRASQPLQAQPADADPGERSDAAPAPGGALARVFGHVSLAQGGVRDV